MSTRALARTPFSVSCAVVALAWMMAASSPVPAHAGSVIYVNDNAIGSNNGSSWADAYTDLKVALAAATAGDQLWVARGTYWIGSATDTVTLKLGVAVYGGFAGSELTLAGRDPDPATNGTVISSGPGHAYHVVTAPADTDGSTVLDGFTVTAGIAGPPVYRGGGLLVYGSPTLANLIVTQNNATSGAGMYIFGGSPTLTDIVFDANTANIFAGGLAIHKASPTMTRLTFTDNDAGSFVYGGGGLHVVGGHPTLTGAVFSGNHARFGGGVHVMSQSPYNEDNKAVFDTSLTLTNAAFANNRALACDGGGMNVSGGLATLTNVVFTNNYTETGNRGGGLYVNRSSDVDPAFTGSIGSATVVNSIFWGNTATSGPQQLGAVTGASLVVSSSDVQGGAAGATGATWGAGNLEVFPFVNSGNPELPEDVDWDGTDDLFGTWDDGLRLVVGSPAVDAGDNAAVAGVAADILGDPRIVDGDHSGTPTVDMGVFESETARVGVSFVNPSATGADDGSSWADAFTDLQHALLVAEPDPTTQIWVVAGSYLPTVGTDRAGTFMLRNGVGVFGGFGGDEAYLDQRDPVAHETVLSGDLLGNDLPAFANRGDNSSHVVSAYGWVDASAVLDGFTIRAGNADASGGGGLYSKGSPALARLKAVDNCGLHGGGMYVGGGDLTLTDSTFSGNHGAYEGGGAHVFAGNPTLTDVTFDGNDSAEPGGGGGNGGGMFVGDENFITPYAGTLTLSHVTFANNVAQFAGGLQVLSGDVSLSDVTFIGNSATAQGGGMIAGDSNWLMDYTGSLTLNGVSFLDNVVDFTISGEYFGGGLEVAYANPTLVNVLFSGNYSKTYGAGIAVVAGNPRVTNATFTGNTAASGSAIWSMGSGTVTNSVLWGDSPNEVVGAYGATVGVDHSIVQMPSPSDPPYAGTGNLNANPLFSGDLHLLTGSPAIDAGSNSAPGLSGVTTDLAGAGRIVDGDENGTATVDMGAYEAQLLTVSYDGNGATGGDVPVDGAAYLEGETVTVLGNTGVLVKTGASFAGWNTAANGSGTGYAGGNTLTMGAGDLILYAQWVATSLVFADGFELGNVSAWSTSFQ